MSLKLMVILVALATLPRRSITEGASIKEVNALKARLMEGYNKYTKPVPSDDYVAVNISVWLQAIGDIDERMEKLTTILEVGTVWTDRSMVWDSNETGISTLWMSRSEMWVPEFRIYNQHYEISYGMEEQIYTLVEYDRGGEAYYGKRIIAETMCELDMSKFPFDTHKCQIILLPDKMINIDTSTLEINERANTASDGLWDLRDHTIDGYTVYITLVRKPLFLLVNLILPITLLALLSPLVFLLPNNSGERVGFSITVLLAISVFMTIVADQVPQKSQPLPRLLVLLLITYSLTVLVAVIVVINARIYRMPNKSHVPRVLVWLHSVTKMLLLLL